MAESVQEAQEVIFEYKKGLKKTAPGLMSKLKYIDIWINRPLASLLVKAVFKTRITPNQLTVLSLIFGISAAVLFAIGQAGGFIWGGILLQISSIVDGADGMLARSRNQCSRFGSYLDLLFDRIVDFFGISALALGAYHYGYTLHVLVLGLLAAGLYCLQICQFYMLKAYMQYTVTGDTGEARAIAIWVILIGTISLRVNLLIYTLLCVIMVINIAHLLAFLRAPRNV